MDRSQKDCLISSLREEFDNVTTVVVAHYTGLTVSDMSVLRTQMREAGGTVKVVKNRLAKIAVVGTKKDCIKQFLTGPTLLALSSDPIVAAKVVNDYAKKNQKLVIVGGAFNSQPLDATEVKNLASMPSLDELRAKLIAIIQTPATRIAGVTSAPAGQLARVLRAYADKVA